MTTPSPGTFCFCECEEGIPGAGRPGAALRRRALKLCERGYRGSRRAPCPGPRTGHSRLRARQARGGAEAGRAPGRRSPGARGRERARVPVGRGGGGAAPLSLGAGPAAPPPGERLGARPPEPPFNWGCQAAARAEGRAGRRPGGRGGGRAARQEAGSRRRGWGPRGRGAVPGQGCPAPAPGHPRSS